MSMSPGDGGLISPPLGEMAEKQPGSLARRAQDPDHTGRIREFQHCLHRRNPAEGSGPGL